MDVIRVLCVDDDLAFLESVKRTLKADGFAVTAATSVSEALDAINNSTFEALLADLNIGEPGGGFAVSSVMRRVQPDASTFIVSGYPDLETALEAIRTQVDGYFPKPSKATDLSGFLTRALRRKKQHGPTESPLKMSEFIRRNKEVICELWLEHVPEVDGLQSLHLSHKQLMDHLPNLIDEIALQLETGTEELRSPSLGMTVLESARTHGQTRHAQGYTIPQIVAETGALRSVLTSLIRGKLHTIDLSSLISEITLIGEIMQSALETSIRAYESQSPTSLQRSLASLYRSPHLGVAIIDEKRVMDANDAFLQMVQHTRDQLISGQVDWVEMTPERYRSIDLNCIEQLREFGACVPFEKEYMLPDGSRMPILTGGVRLSADPLRWCAYVVDLTKHQLVQQAEQKVREWQAKHALINRLAHDINNPLGALMFTIHLLGTHANVSGDACDLVRDAAQMLDRVAAVVKQVLNESYTAPD